MIVRVSQRADSGRRAGHETTLRDTEAVRPAHPGISRSTPPGWHPRRSRPAEHADQNLQARRSLPPGHLELDLVHDGLTVSAPLGDVVSSVSELGRERPVERAGVEQASDAVSTQVRQDSCLTSTRPASARRRRARAAPERGTTPMFDVATLIGGSSPSAPGLRTKVARARRGGPR